MYDIWAFLLQTLTLSGVAILLLVLKRLFRDKLTPRWQFGIWAVLGVSMLLPAGLGGRYVLFNWPIAVDYLKMMAGDYTFTRVRFPFPVLRDMPRSLPEWLFAVYTVGVMISLLRYLISYLRLRLVTRKGSDVSGGLADQIRNTAIRYGLKNCNVVMVKGLPSAFVCGVFRPVLVVPEEQVDDKILLHELIHLKNRDTLWSMVVCLFRSLHWCNPLLVYCAKQALNDLEGRCDQMVLELLEGEERREYGRILLSMVNDRYAGTPGATCVNNGGSAIRQRIESIARFRLYPAGMKLVSICSVIILLMPVVLGVRATTLYESTLGSPMELASARTIYCSTPAGAFDCYAKAMLTGKDSLRVMCAPEEEQAELAGIFGYWEPELPEDPLIQSGYYLYNLVCRDDAYEGLLVIVLSSPPAEHNLLLGYQPLRAEREQGRWIVRPLDEIQSIEVPEIRTINWSCPELPGFRYSAAYGDYIIELQYQTVYDVDNWIYTNGFFGGSTSFDLTPKPHAEFSQVAVSQDRNITHLGTQEQRDAITHLGLGLEPVMAGEERPDHTDIYYHQSSSSSSSDGSSWCNRAMEPGWGPVLNLYGGGSKFQAEEYLEELPTYYLADLYIDHKFIASLDLVLQEGGPR